MHTINVKTAKLSAETLAQHIALELAEAGAPKLRTLPPCRRGGYHKNKRAYDRKQGKRVEF